MWVLVGRNGGETEPFLSFTVAFSLIGLFLLYSPLLAEFLEFCGQCRDTVAYTGAYKRQTSGDREER